MSRQVPDGVTLTCPHCDCDDETEIVVDTDQGWGCFCNSCGRSFGVKKPEPPPTTETKETP